jgi:hypothetical protein
MLKLYGENDMQTLKVNPKKTLADYGFTTTKTVAKTPKPTGLKRITVADWWTNLPENQDKIPVYMHFAMYTEFYATVTRETEKAYLLSIKTPTGSLERWLPKKAVHDIEELQQ